MPIKPPGLLAIGRQQYYTPAPGGPDEYYRGTMPEYVAPNQDRLATQPNDQMLYSDAKREGLPIERINDVPDMTNWPPEYIREHLADRQKAFEADQRTNRALNAIPPDDRAAREQMSVRDQLRYYDAVKRQKIGRQTYEGR